jgi:hypothetical protein
VVHFPYNNYHALSNGSFHYYTDENIKKINAHEMYMNIHDQDNSFSNNKKDLALKTNQEKKVKVRVQVKEDSSSDDDIDEAKLALMVNKTTKMLKKLNYEVIKFDSIKN